MITIENEAAAAEAKRLARDHIETAMSSFAELPEGVGLHGLLADAGLELREAKADSPTFRRNQPHETVEVKYTLAETAGTAHAQAITELTTNRTADLTDNLTASAVAQRRRMLRNELAAERDCIGRPLRLGWLPGVKERRCLQRDALTQNALDTLDGVPLSATLVDEVLASVLKLAGDEGLYADTIRKQAVALHREFQARRETILMLAWEAINSDNTGADVELDLAGRRGRFARSKAELRATEEKKQAERILTAEKKRDEEIRRKRAQIVREQEERRRWNEMTRPKWSPDENEPDKEPGLGE